MADIVSIDSSSETQQLVARDAAAFLTPLDFKVLVEVAGATGIVVDELMSKNRKMSGVIVELPAGDPFAWMPSADLYLLNCILHDWDGERCIAILQTCRRMLMPGGRLIVIESDEGRNRSVEEYERLLGTAGWKVRTGLMKKSPSCLIIEAV